MNAIYADHLSFTYPGLPHPALADLTFSIPQGQFVAILGANGSGKSTLARLLAGLLAPFAGTLEVLGHDLSRPDGLQALGGRVGLVFQSPDDQMVAATVEREIAFGPENLGLPPAEIRARVDRLMQRFDLTRYAQRPPHELSGGEKQRVVLASILAMQPEILVFDEVTSLLDSASRHDILSLLHQMKGQYTILLITQFPEEALRADRLLLLHEGRLLCDAPPHDLFSQAPSDEIFGVEVPLLYRLLRAASQ